MSNFAQFTKQVESWFSDVEALAVGVARGLSVELFHRALEYSPQFSGDFAANWRYAVDRIDTTFRPLDAIPSSTAVPFGRSEHGWLPRMVLDDDGSRRMGSPEAIEEGRRRNAGKERSLVSLGQTAYISNTSWHDEYYAMLIENNQIRFRPGNVGGTGKRAMNAVSVQYGKVLGRAEALELRLKTIGV